MGMMWDSVECILKTLKHPLASLMHSKFRPAGCKNSIDSTLYKYYIATPVHRVWRASEHVTPHTHNINSKIQTWQTFSKIIYSLYSKNYDKICNYHFTIMEPLMER